MIKAIFQLSSNDITSAEVILPAVPSVGHQIFLSDFITEDEENKIFKKYPNMNINSLIVKYVTWLRNQKNKEIYILISLEL